MRRTKRKPIGMLNKSLKEKFMQIINQINPTLKGLSSFYMTVTCIAFVALIGLFDHMTGYEISFSIFFLIPIYVASWYVSYRIGLLISFISAITWLTVEYTSGHRYSHDFIPFWNAAVRFGFFLIICNLLTKLKSHIELERNIARADALTGAMNSRAFEEEARKIFNLSTRHGHPCTLLYMDVDDFKTINDTLGHSEGDRLLTCIAETLLNSVRSYDCIARLGGDEFAVLLPETGQHDAQKFLSKIHHHLLEAVKQNDWPVSFSIGAVTFTKPTATVDQAIKLADQIMYKVKTSGKNDIAFEIWSGNRYAA